LDKNCPGSSVFVQWTTFEQPIVSSGQKLSTEQMIYPVDNFIQCLEQRAQVSTINKTIRHDVAEILLNVVLNTITLNPLYNKEEIIHDTWQ